MALTAVKRKKTILTALSWKSIGVNGSELEKSGVNSVDAEE